MTHAANLSLVSDSPRWTYGLIKEIADRKLILQLPETNYELELQLVDPGIFSAVLSPQPVCGLIDVRAQRVDVVGTGGLFIEPVIGPPRHFQGRILQIDPQANALLLRCAPGCVVRAELTDPRQHARDFQPGQIVAFDALPGARFQPAADSSMAL